jgi:hypothetical protein
MPIDSTDYIAKAKNFANAEKSNNPTAIAKAKNDFERSKKQLAASASTDEDKVKLANLLAKTESNEEGHPEDCKCTDCCTHPEGCKCGCQDHESDSMNQDEEVYSSYSESAQIVNFIKALSQKNYASANKYLQGVVEGKLKTAISKAANK